MISMRKKMFVIFFLLIIGHYNNINKHFHLNVLFFKSLLPQGNIVPLRTHLNILHFHAEKKLIYLLLTSISLTKHLNRQIYLVFNLLHISYLIKSNISYPAVTFRQHCTIVDHKYNQTITVIISKHYNQGCFKVKKK